MLYIYMYIYMYICIYIYIQKRLLEMDVFFKRLVAQLCCLSEFCLRRCTFIYTCTHIGVYVSLKQIHLVMFLYGHCIGLLAAVEGPHGSRPQDLLRS